MQNNGSNYLEITIQYPQKNKSYLSSWYYRTGSFFVPTCNRKQTLPKRKMKVQTNTLPIKPRHYAKTAIVTLPLRTPESERYLLTLPYIFSAHLAHKARKTKPKLSHAIKGYIPKIAWFRHLSLSIQAQKKKKQQLRTSRSGVRVPSSAPNEKDTAFAVSFFLLVRLPAQASRYALAFAGRDSRAKNVPLERFTRWAVLFLFGALAYSSCVLRTCFRRMQETSRWLVSERSSTGTFFDALHFKRAGTSRCVFIFMGN